MSQEYALISPEGAVDRYSFNIDPNTGTKAGWKWLPVTRWQETLGVGQVYGVPVTEIDKDGVTVTTPARDKTQAEIDAEIESQKAAALSRLGDAGVKMLLDLENRVAALEGREPSTEAEIREKIGEKEIEGKALSAGDEAIR